MIDKLARLIIRLLFGFGLSSSIKMKTNTETAMLAGDDGELKVDEPEDVEEVAARLQQLRSLITERFL